jgi:hypothetical protein
MHYKTNRLNHDFQIAYFIAGSCQTADAAYSILCDLKEDRSNAIKSFGAYSKRDAAKVRRAEAKIAEIEMRAICNDHDRELNECDLLDAQADIEELRALADTTQKNYDAALAELAFIEACMEKLQPFRQFAHLPDAQAHEAAQFNEWKLQLVHTAQNHMLSTNNIPADHWATMRMHPAFEKEILPAIDNFVRVKSLAGSPEGQKQLTSLLVKKNYELPPLLEAQEPKPQLGTKE